MNLSMVGRHIDLTDGIKSHIESGLETLKKYNLDIISIRAVIDTEEKKGQKTVSVEFSIFIAHSNIIVIKHKDKDLYVAIDSGINRASKVLRRYHDKLTDHQAEGTEESTFLQFTEDTYPKAHDEIIPMEFEFDKPMDIEEAIFTLKDSDRLFIVFYDLDNKMRVLYKKKKGVRKFGLY